MTYIGNLQKSELNAFLTETFKELTNSIAELKKEVTELKSAINNKQSDTMTIKEASDYLKVTKQTLYNYISTGILQKHKIGRRTLFYREEIINFLNNKKTQL